MAATAYRTVTLDKLHPDPNQVRKTFNGLKELPASLKGRGVLTPIVVREQGKKLIIMDGERRYRAAKLAKVKTVPVVVQPDAGDVQRKLDQVAVNSLREGLKPLELGRLLVGLRKDHKLSDNEIAAHLDKQGIPALTKAQMAELMRLVDLPDWAQEMVDAGKLDPKAAPAINAAAKDAPLLKPLRKHIGQEIQWRGRVTAREVESLVVSAYRETGAPDLGRIDDWMENPVLFDSSKACKGCEHRRDVHGKRFCMNQKHFDELQAQAKAAGLGPGGKKPTKPRGPGPKETEVIAQQKAERKVELYGEKLRHLVHGRLQEHLVTAHMNPYLASILMTWLAARQPNGKRYGDQQWFSQGENPYRAVEDAVEASPLKDLPGFLNGNAGELAALDLALGKAAIRGMSWRQVQILAHHLKVDIAQAFRVDEAYLAIQPLYQLKELGRLAGIEGTNTATGKALKAAILGDRRCIEKLGVPADVGRLYLEVPEPDPEEDISEEEYSAAQGDGGDEEPVNLDDENLEEPAA